MSTTKPASAPSGSGADTVPLNWNEYVEEFRRAGHDAVEWIARYLAEPRRYPVLPAMKPGDLVDALPKSGPDTRESLEHILRDFDEKIVPAVTHWNHPGFLAYFATSGTSPAVLGEMLAAALNTNGLHWKTSPAVAELEQVALDWLRQWIGLPEGWFGIVYDTASTSSFHGLVCARQLVDPEARVRGMRGDLAVYTSEQSHSSIEKGAIAAGFGQKNVRKVPTDAEFRMRPEALRELIRGDQKNGLRPCCIVATVGTTSSTSVDPVPAIADIAEECGAWLHVDAAYAGAAALLPELAEHFRGLERAHSLVVNAHKWLLTNIDLSAFYTRRPDVLRGAFELVPEYLRKTEDARAHNLMDYGVPLGHRFRALKLWFVLRYFGRERIAEILRRHISWAQRFAALVDASREFERVAPAPFSVVCFRYRGSDDENRAILEKVNASGRVFLSHTELRGRFVLRLAIGNLATEWQDVEWAWELLQAAAQ